MKVECYLAPDWGMALRINGLLESEFGGDCVRVVGPWRHGPVYGSLFAITSERFPPHWQGRLLDLDERPWEKVFSGKLSLHPNPDREKAVLSSLTPALPAAPGGPRP